MPRDKDRQDLVTSVLTEMYESDPELYERILDTPGFAALFNELTRLAMGESPRPEEDPSDD